MIRSLALLCLLLASCSTSPKIYQPPDAARVNQATRELTKRVADARDTAAHARKSTAEARESAVRLIQIEGDVKMKLEKLRVQVPEQYRPAVVGVQNAQATAEQATAEQRQKLDEAIGWNNRLEGELRQAEEGRATLQKAQGEYVKKATTLAKDASNERAARVKAESALHWYRWHWWGAWIVMGLGILGCVVLAFLKLTGKVAVL